ncbi:MAG: hypothetical protein ACOX1P_22710 [Thermoguttaceae bacterium]|jgi:hypothetical protein
MGQVSKKLRNRFGKLASRVTRQLAKEVASLRAPKGVKDVPTLVVEVSKADWVAYLNRAMLQVKIKDDEKRLHVLLG